jgi:hypothetical protein
MGAAASGLAPIPARRHEKMMRWLSLVLVVGVLSAAFLLPLVNISRYHRTISETIARSLGHPVHLGSVKLQLLPRPGLAITDFVVEENADFGAEPFLRAPSVVVSVRLSSLWRGRLEVSRIDLDEASVNLVRNAAGQWNFGSLLEQASGIPNAPTAQKRSGSSPRFPYIQFKAARINFKSGSEKKGFAFLNSDLSIWLDNPKQWRLRFEAQPARTDLDLDLEDTGLMRIEGSLDRATTLDQMPVKLHAEWSGAPLGQASRMLFADDKGWRGDLRAEANIAGDIRDLHLQTRVRVANAHREEFSPLTSLNVDARCRAEYRHGAHSLEDLTCLWPVESGHLLVTGNLRDLAAPESQLNLEINQIPASFALQVLGLVRATVPPSWNAQGLINGNFTYATAVTPKWSGEATVRPLSVSFADGATPFVLPALHFTSEAATVAGDARHRKSAVHAAGMDPGTLRMEPVEMDMGAPNPLQISGQFTSTGFSLRLTGESGVKRLKDLSAAFALLHSAAANLMPQGLADADLTFAGPWLAKAVITDQGFTQPSTTTVVGWMHLQNARAKLEWLPEPVVIASAGADFGDGRIRWSNASVSVNGIAIRGSADAPLACEGVAVCTAHFNVEVPELDAATLQSALLGAGRHGELLESILAQVQRPVAAWPAMSGEAHVGVFSVGALELHDVRSLLSVQDHRLEVTSLDAAALGGSVHTAGSVEASGSPRYGFSATWSGIDVSRLAALFQEKWPAAGRMDGGADLKLQGYAAQDLASSAQGTFHWRWTDGALTSPGSEDASSLTWSSNHFNQWNAIGTVANSTLTLTKAGPANLVSGTIGFDRSLDLAWPGAKPGAPMHIGGTLARPVIEGAKTTAEQE